MGILNNLRESCNQTWHSVWMLNAEWSMSTHSIRFGSDPSGKKNSKIFSIGADTDTEYPVGASLA